MMTQPVDVNVDLAARAAYVEYVAGPSAQTVDLNESGGVAYDVGRRRHHDRHRGPWKRAS